MIKVISLLTRRAGMTREEFHRYWTDVHAAMVDTVPQVRRFHLNFIVGEPARSDVPTHGLNGAVDGIAEAWFDDEDSFREFWGSAAAARWLADGAEFIGREQDFMVEERVVLADTRGQGTP